MNEIYIQLLDEGTTTYRPTQGIDQGNGIFYVLSTTGYDPEIENWEFPPGSLVFCEQIERPNGNFLLAKRLSKAER